MPNKLLGSYIVIDADIIVKACDKGFISIEHERKDFMRYDIIEKKRKRNKKWIYYNLFIKKHISFGFLKKKIHFNYKEEFTKLEENISNIIKNGSIMSIYSNEHVINKIRKENKIRKLECLKRFASLAMTTSDQKVYLSQDNFEMIEDFIEIRGK